MSSFLQTRDHGSAVWAPSSGRELDATPLRDVVLITRLVACLNVWNDITALEHTLPTWIDVVDHVIAVDGAYDTTEGHALSTDGTREYLSRFPKVELIDAPGLSQCHKRTVYLDAGRPGDMMVIIDADESIANASALRVLPRLDVGWIRMQNSLYAHDYGQPRIIRWTTGLHYRGRHHWMYRDDRLLCTHQYGGAGFTHRVVPITFTNHRHLGRVGPRLHAKRSHQSIQHAIEEPLVACPTTAMSDRHEQARESLRILTFAYRDDGMAPSRLHTAINRTTPHASLCFKGRPGPYDVPEQFSTTHDTDLLMAAIASCDVAHYHGVMSYAKQTPRSTMTVFHHHGTLLRNNFTEYTKQAVDRNALVLVSNLELLTWTEGTNAHFLPNTVPVERYRTLAISHPRWTGDMPFRVAHSPSVRSKKGTEQFLLICGALQDRGIPIEPVLIENQTHANALRMKASCHACFDSFWLGMQCSGIEAAAMGMPVIAGDETVASRYLKRHEYIPYTFANNADQLMAVLLKLINDDEYRRTETNRVVDHVRTYHDESAVALQYLDLLDTAFGWRSVPIRSRAQRSLR